MIITLAGGLVSQTVVDSLETLLPQVSGQDKVELLNQLSHACWGISSEKTIEYGTLALDLARKLSDRQNEALALKNIGVGHSNLREDNKALEYYEKALLNELEQYRDKQKIRFEKLSQHVAAKGSLSES